MWRCYHSVMEIPPLFWDLEDDPTVSVSIYFNLLLRSLLKFVLLWSRTTLCLIVLFEFVLFLSKLLLYSDTQTFLNYRFLEDFSSLFLDILYPFQVLSCHIITSHSYSFIQIPNQSHIVLSSTSEWLLLIHHSATYLHHPSEQLGN